MSTSYNGWPAIPTSTDPRLTVLDLARLVAESQES